MIKLQVIGYPIKHSLSPKIHSTVMDFLEVPYLYEAKEIREEELESYINKARQENVLGFNVTMPHKQSIMKFLDSIDEAALLYGAVNTVKNIDGKLYGYNTDGDRVYDVT